MWSAERSRSKYSPGFAGVSGDAKLKYYTTEKSTQGRKFMTKKVAYVSPATMEFNIPVNEIASAESKSIRRTTVG